MNRLVDALVAQRQVVDRAVEMKIAPFQWLQGVLGDAMLATQEQELIGSDVDLCRRLGEGYLPVITAADWNHALEASEAVEAIEGHDPGGPGWWTVMIASTTGTKGLTVPQDFSDASLVALFTGPADKAATLIYDPALRSLVAGLSAGVHCGAPSRGQCAPGSCGKCHARRVWNAATGVGIRCICPDSGL